MGVDFRAAGTVSGRLAAYRVNQETGALTASAAYDLGQRPAAVLIAGPSD
jgi:hypothetical protein